jgi:catechol 2,3-dioxygenase-like lactoylglutathione lyase family enzyme
LSARPPFDQQVTFLYTGDLPATDQFYRDVIGLPLVLDQGPCRIYRVAGDAFLGFCTRAEITPQPISVIFTLVVGDTATVDRWHRRLAERGVSFEKLPTLNPTYNIYHCFVRDPNGYLLEIQAFLDPAWPS